MNKFKVGDKVKTKLGGQVLTIKKIKGNRYTVEENVFSWLDEHLFRVNEIKKVEEQFEVGDIVYCGREKVKLLSKAWKVYDLKSNYSYFMEEQHLKKQPLKEITEKELADMGYMIKR